MTTTMMKATMATNMTYDTFLERPAKFVQYSSEKSPLWTVQCIFVNDTRIYISNFLKCRWSEITFSLRGEWWHYLMPSSHQIHGKGTSPVTTRPTHAHLSWHQGEMRRGSSLCVDSLWLGLCVTFCCHRRVKREQNMILINPAAWCPHISLFSTWLSRAAAPVPALVQEPLSGSSQ